MTQYNYRSIMFGQSMMLGQEKYNSKVQVCLPAFLLLTNESRKY